MKKVLKGLRFGLAAGAIASLTVPMGASAADRFWLRDDSANGIRFGAGRLHSSIELETRYDSFAGWGQTAPAADGPEKVGDMVVHLKPALKLEVPSRTFQIGAAAGLDYVGYTGAQESWTSKQSKLNADLGFKGVVNPEGNYRLELDERFVRSDRSSNLELGVLTISNRNDVGLGFQLAAGAGTWVFRPSYTNTVENFEAREGETAGASVDRWNYMRHNIGLDIGWKATPKSAVVLETNFGVRNYSEAASETFDSQSLRVMAGYVGLVAPKIELKAKAGYGAQFASDEARKDEGFSGLLGQGEVGYLHSEKTKVSLGYVHGFSASPTTSLHYTNDRGYLSGVWALSREVGAKATFAYDTLRFSEGRRDEIFSLALGPEYQPNDMMALGANYGFMNRESNTHLPSYEYDRHEFGAYVALRY